MFLGLMEVSIPKHGGTTYALCALRKNILVILKFINYCHLHSTSLKSFSYMLVELLSVKLLSEFKIFKELSRFTIKTNTFLQIFGHLGLYQAK